MNTLMTMTHTQTMTSREIAEVVESRHDNVKRTIERLVESGVIKLPPLEEVKNHLGQTTQHYLINKRDSYVVVAQLSPAFTARLVDRWQELEAQQQQSLPQTHIAAVEAYLETLKTVEAQQQQLVQQMGVITKQEAILDHKAILTDDGEDYYSVSRMRKLNSSQGFSGRRLALFSEALGYEIRPLFTPNSQATMTYHKDVWLKAYPEITF